MTVAARRFCSRPAIRIRRTLRRPRHPVLRNTSYSSTAGTSRVSGQSRSAAECFGRAPPDPANRSCNCPEAVRHSHPMMPSPTRSRKYAGRWLAGSAPVGNTELVVLVEERYEDAVAPQQWFFRRFLAWAIGLAAAGLAAFAALRLVQRYRRSEAG